MDRVNLDVLGRLGMAGVLCAGALIGSGCGRDAATGPNSLVGPTSVAVEVASGPAVPPMAMHSGVLTPDELKAHGWSCRVTPVGTTACSPPGRGLPVFGAPEDRPPSYLVHAFDTATGAYLGFARMIRTDLYQDQICPSTGAAYVELPHIGYWECFNPVGDL